ncbi:putative MFS transporter [Sclerotinia borealis F-4128]|uniref:Putative MFS transporter n=1 Tax=Sclerotinia borealis (strain F-4128) TaxID=1432307 RepID=W9C3Z6_SCLBF|nr:putative MFS transporter [Sclerotinia borealis F-4128]
MSIYKTHSLSSGVENGDSKITTHDHTKSIQDPESKSGPASESAHISNHQAERALCRKFDCRLLPVLACMYLFNSLDKGNLGNSKTDGLERDLGFENNQYNLILSVFYIPYVLCALPIAMLGKKYGPATVLPILMMFFGSFTILGVAAQNFGGMMALRWFLVIYYLTTFYRRGELARRLAIFYAASNIASAFSGLLAVGCFKITNTPLYPWRYLFLIEGSATLLFSIFTYFYLPSSASTAKFLTSQERNLAHHRIRVDSSSTVNEKFHLADSLLIFAQPTTYAFLAIEICLGVPLQSVTLFLPQIVARLGYSPIKTNLYTVAPNISGAVMLLILAFASDYTRRRGPFIALGFAFTFIGFIIYVSIDVTDQLHVAYFATFMMCWGTAAPSVLLSTWYNNNIPHEGRRVVMSSVGVPLSNLMGLVSSNVFLNRDAPKYIPALATTAAFGATGVILSTSLALYMMMDNRRRDRKLGRRLDAAEIPTELLRDGPGVAEFRWFL